MEEDQDALDTGRSIPISYDRNEARYYANLIKEMEHGRAKRNVENNPAAHRVHQVLATRRELNQRYLRNQAEINRQQSREMQREDQEQRAAEDYVRQMQEYDQLQGSGAGASVMRGLPKKETATTSEEQKGGSRGIQRRRRALTQQQNRALANRLADDYNEQQNRQGNFVMGAEYNRMQQEQAALQPLRGTPMHRNTRNMQDSNEYFDLEHGLDTFQHHGYIPETIASDLDGDTLEEMTDTIQALEEAEDDENQAHLQRARRMIPMQVAANLRDRRRQAEINRQQRLENERETEEQRLARTYARQQGLTFTPRMQQEDEDRRAELEVKRIRGKTLTPSEQREYEQLQGSGAENQARALGFATYVA